MLPTLHALCEMWRHLLFPCRGSFDLKGTSSSALIRLNTVARMLHYALDTEAGKGGPTALLWCYALVKTLSDEAAFLPQLLAKAGYKGSGGLGPSESGITSPVPAWHNQGRTGIGSVPNQATASGGQMASRTGQLSTREVQHGSQDSTKLDQLWQTRKRNKAPNKDWATVRVEEDVQVTYAAL